MNTVWLEHLQHLPDRIKAIYSNVKLLRKCTDRKEVDNRKENKDIKDNDEKKADEDDNNDSATSKSFD